MELGETLLELERLDDAAVAFERVLKFDPANATALYNSGVIRARRNDYRAAVSLWRQAAVAAPGSDVAARARADAKTAVQLGHLFSVATEMVHAH